MPTTDFNTDNKIFIRNYFNKILIRHLREVLSYDVVYFGLPAGTAEDIFSWVDYIDYVIAFQCREYPKPSDPEQSMDEIDKLMDKLNHLETRKLIKGFTLYDGYMEEVIFRGYDNSFNSLEFTYNNTVTIFNMDFCNRITSPQKYINEKGEEVESYKFELIDKILSLQNKESIQDNKFVFFLTINCGYAGKELETYTVTHNLHNRYADVKKLKRKEKILRHFVEDTLYHTIETNGFIPHFLPTIVYNGVNDVRMLQFAVMCIKPNNSKRTAGVFVKPQSLDSVLQRKAITPNTNEIRFDQIAVPNLNEVDVEINFMNEFVQSRTYQRYWR